MRSRGLTLVELLVVIAIVGLLIGLMLPAIQAARSVSRRSACGSQLRQIGTATQAYLEARGHLPPGNVLLAEGQCEGGGASATSQSGSNWAIQLLPYLEEQALYESYDFREFNEAPANQRVREAWVTTYWCPADAPEPELSVPESGPAGRFAMKLGYRPGSYRAMTGRSEGRSFLDSSAFLTYPRQWRGAIHTVGVRGFGHESPRTIRDGLAQTLMIGESSSSTGPGWQTLWAYSYSHYSLSAATPQSRVLIGDYDKCVALGGSGSSLPCRRGWGSKHGGGMNFLTCGGSVQFVGDDLDPELFAKLATIDGRESVELP